ALKKDKAPPPSKSANKGKQKEKVNNMVLFNQGTYDKLLMEAPKYKLITISILFDRLKIIRSFIWIVSAHASRQIYTRATNT
ncbi:40S ribosomal protein S25-2, partial [Pyrus ussuriensis x Pyrus communis]